MSKTVLYGIGALVLAILLVGGGFFAGNAYGQSQAQASVSNFQRQRAAGASAQGGAGGANPCGFGGFRGGANGGANGTGGGGNGGNFGNNSGGGNASGSSGGNFGGGGNGGGFGGFGGFNAQMGRCVAAGQVKAVDGDTVQISTADNVVTVKLGDKTMINKMATGTAADLTPGTRVIVFSTETGDSPTASLVQIQRAAGQ